MKTATKTTIFKKGALPILNRNVIIPKGCDVKNDCRVFTLLIGLKYENSKRIFYYFLFKYKSHSFFWYTGKNNVTGHSFEGVCEVLNIWTLIWKSTNNWIILCLPCILPEFIRRNRINFTKYNSIYFYKPKIEWIFSNKVSFLF